MTDQHAPQGNNDGGLNLLTVHDNANRALMAIEFHSIECDKRQERIEKAQEDIKGSVSRVTEKISATASDVNKKIDTVNASLNDKINVLNYKIAMIFGGLLLLREIVVAYFHTH